MQILKGFASFSFDGLWEILQQTFVVGVVIHQKAPSKENDESAKEKPFTATAAAAMDQVNRLMRIVRGVLLNGCFAEKEPRMLCTLPQFGTSLSTRVLRFQSNVNLFISSDCTVVLHPWA